MTIAQSAPPLSLPDHIQLSESDTSHLSLPDHNQLPESNGTFVVAKRAGGNYNFQEYPQSLLISSLILPVLEKLHPDGQYAIGQDCGIYWRLTEPLEKGAEAPDGFYVPNVTPLLDGGYRRSYVMGKYQKMLPNDRGHFAIEPLGVELGIWQGEYVGQVLPWLRLWDLSGDLLLSGDERAVQEKLRGDQEKLRADQETERADRLAEKLRELGINPEAL